MRKPWVAIIWFAVWGLFQAYAVASVLSGTWQRPQAFPEEAYNALIYPDMLFIPLYLLASILLTLRKPLGRVLAFVSGGGVLYVMVYLLALSGFQGTENLVLDGVFLTANGAALVQVWRMDNTRGKPWNSQ